MTWKIVVIGIVVTLLLGVLATGCAGVSAYNRLIVADENVGQAWAQVENSYQRRFDLIPNLEEAVRGYAKHEKGVFVEVAKARASVGQTKITPQSIPTADQWAQFSKAQGELGLALSRLLVVSEKYPELKANENFMDLQKQIQETENRVTVERKRFVESVNLYNVSVRQFPTSIVASVFGFNPKPQYTAESGSVVKVAPKVKF